MTKPLPKMLEDVNEPSYVRELLEAGRDFRVTDYDYGKGLAQHLAHVQAGTPPPDWAQSLHQGGSAAGGGAASAGAASIPLAVWIAVPVVTAGVVAAVMLSSAPPPAPAPEQALDVPAVVSPAGEELPVEAPPAPTATPEPEPADEPAAAAVVPEPEREPVARREHAASHRPVAAKPARPVEAPRAVTEAPAEPPATATTTTPATTTAAPSRPRSAAQRARDLEDVLREPAPSVRVDEPARAEPTPVKQEPAERDDASLEREMRMLAVAQRVLHSDPGRALRLARQGEREFPDTMFTQERQHVLLLALVELGRMDEARRLAAPYLKQYPKGPFSDRVRRALATGRVER